MDIEALGSQGWLDGNFLIGFLRGEDSDSEPLA